MELEGEVSQPKLGGFMTSKLSVASTLSLVQLLYTSLHIRYPSSRV